MTRMTGELHCIQTFRPWHRVSRVRWHLQPAKRARRSNFDSSILLRWHIHETSFQLPCHQRNLAARNLGNRRHFTPQSRSGALGTPRPGDSAERRRRISFFRSGDPGFIHLHMLQNVRVSRRRCLPTAPRDDMIRACPTKELSLVTHGRISDYRVCCLDLSREGNNAKKPL
jgi:hypothetical protein